MSQEKYPKPESQTNVFKKLKNLLPIALGMGLSTGIINATFNIPKVEACEGGVTYNVLVLVDWGDDRDPEMVRMVDFKTREEAEEAAKLNLGQVIENNPVYDYYVAENEEGQTTLTKTKPDGSYTRTGVIVEQNRVDKVEEDISRSSCND